MVQFTDQLGFVAACSLHKINNEASTKLHLKNENAPLMSYKKKHRPYASFTGRRVQLFQQVCLH